ncbi:protocadherin gamma-B5-like isoform X4 [Spea bombifrons]|uniref:protocadherin gamma-B5-like isoform X4 n=1 Tax=Spea bombifrons TaxID=233779 RepID=UPI00234B0119|nr:protocadherin gamma-B5-like isoform X4 [Spea bombifrons]
MTTMKIQALQKGKAIKWQVMFFFLFFWFCHSVSGQLHYSIVEEMRKDSVVANIANDLGLDVKLLSFRRLRIASHISDAYFSVNLDNGDLYIKHRIDRETLCGIAATCLLIFDVVVENPLNVFDVKIEILDVNDNAPKFFHDTIRLEIIEYTLPGTRFLLQNAEDPDIGINSVQTYKLSDNQYFTLSEKASSDGSKFPELVLEKPLDRETQNIYEFILTALDNGKPTKSGTALITIIITDVNDNSPIFSQDIYKASVSENTPINSIVLSVSASDKDEGSNAEITYSFSKTSGNILYMFDIHPTNGEIKAIGNLDFEATHNYEMSIQAKDGGGFVTHCKVLIEITDENDNAPKISITSLATPIPEDSIPGTVIALIEVHDDDSGKNGEVHCQIIENVPLELVLSSGRFYRIVTTNTIDREKNSHYNFTVLASDMGSPSLSSTVASRLDILDINDNPPLFMKSTYSSYVPENNLPGASIYKIYASDLDTGDNGKVVYSICNINNINTGDIPASSYFSMNIETGVLYAQRSFDYEQHKEFEIQITAKDKGTPSLSNNTTLIIHIVDQNDNAPQILYPLAESGGAVSFEMVPFISEEGYLITKVVAVDADSGHNAWLTYYFIQVSESSHFSINQHTGEIRTSKAFHEKDIIKNKIVVMVKDNGFPSLSATATLSLIIGNNIHQVLPELSNRHIDQDSTSNLHLYLVIALALISLLFILTVLLVIISKCREPKSSVAFGSLTSNLYSEVDPRMFSQYNNGTLSLPYPYNVCVALDSSENDFTFIKPNQNVPIENLIDADNSQLGNEGLKENLDTDNQQAQPNTDWRFSQAQRPGPSGAQPTEEAGVWPNNQFETERLQAMILASANEAAEGSSALGGGTGTMGLSARYGPQFTLQHVPDYRQNIYIPGTTSTLTNAAGKRDGKAAAPSGGNKKKSGKKDKK